MCVFSLIYTVLGRIKRRPLTSEAQIHSQSTWCEIYDVQSMSVADSSLSTSFSPCQYHSNNVLFPYFILLSSTWPRWRKHMFLYLCVTCPVTRIHTSALVPLLETFLQIIFNESCCISALNVEAIPNESLWRTLNPYTWLNCANTINVLTLAVAFCINSVYRKCCMGLVIVRPLIFGRNRCRRYSRIWM